MKKIFYLLAFSFGVQTLASQNLSVGLSACYPFNGNANDLISGLNGTLNAVTPTLDRNNQTNSAYAFSGSPSSYIELPDHPLLKSTTGLSFSSWIKISSFTASDMILFTKNNSNFSFAAYCLLIHQTSGNYRFRAYKENGSTINFVESTTIVSLNTWYHVTFTMDNTSLRIYVNGNLENTIPSNLNFDYATGKTIIFGGTNESFYNPAFHGAIDNARFYSRILTPAEVSELYTQDPACIEVVPAPVATFTANKEIVCRNQSIVFTDLSTNNPTSWSWSVSPGNAPAPAAVANPTYNFPSTGTFTVTLVSSNNGGPSNTATMAVTVANCDLVGINETQVNHFNVFPNPTTNFIEIQNAERVKNYFLCDVSGRHISSNSLHADNNLQIDLRDLPKGLYFLVLETETGYNSLKIVKE